MPDEDTFEDLPGNFRWFDDSIAGCAVPFLPGAARALHDEGITAVVSVIPDHDFPRKEEFMAEVVNEGLAHEQIEVPNLGAPTSDQIDRFLSFVTPVIEDGGKVVIHCVGGRGRTCTMAGICLMDRGTPYEDMKSKIKHVETKEQEDALLNFALSRAGRQMLPPPRDSEHDSNFVRVADEWSKPRHKI